MMNYNALLIMMISGLALVGFGINFLLKRQKEQKLQAIKALSFDDNERAYLLKLAHYKNLSVEEKKKIENSILLFIHTKEFRGVNLEVTDEMKIIIAFYACLLLLHIKTDNCYDALTTIIIYPHAVVTKTIKSFGGIYTKEKFFIEGESANNTVVISWHEAKKEAYHLRHNNVIIHEFAHEIDFMDGAVDGVPPIEKSKYNEWTHVLFQEFNKLKTVALKNRYWGKYKLLGSYAATNEAEFFAVATERFFESPESLKKNFPELYDELEGFYHRNQ